MDQFVQRCINGDCRREFGIEERVYVCAGCGDLLEIEREGESGI